MAVVYASSTLSLAALEPLVHVDPATAPKDLVAIEIDVPAGVGITVAAPANIPADRRATTAPAACRAVGDAFVAGGRDLVLDVPSVIIPGERNWLLNPGHADMAQVVVRSVEPFQFGPRLLYRAPGA